MVAGAEAKFERFYRVVADLDVDKNDVRIHEAFLHDKIYDLLLMAQVTAKANGRDIIEPQDLPITMGLQERIHEHRRMDQDGELAPILEYLATRPQLDLAVGAATEARLPEIAGGLSDALARSFKIIDPDLRNPQTRHWQRAFELFDLVL